MISRRLPIATRGRLKNIFSNFRQESMVRLQITHREDGSMLPTRRCLPLILTLSALSGCATIGDLYPLPEIRVESLTPLRMTPAVAEFLAVLSVTNDTMITLPVRRLEYTLRADGRLLLSGALISMPALKPLHTQKYELPLRLGFRTLTAAGPDPESPLSLKWSGVLILSDRLKCPPLPFTSGLDIPRPRFPRMILDGVRARATGKTLEISLRVENPNPFPVTITGLNGTVEAGGRVYPLSRQVRAQEIGSSDAGTLDLRLDAARLTGPLAANGSGVRAEVCVRGEADGKTPYGYWHWAVDTGQKGARKKTID